MMQSRPLSEPESDAAAIKAMKPTLNKNASDKKGIDNEHPLEIESSESN